MNSLKSESFESAITELDALSRALIAAAEAEDLDSLGEALDARGRALRQLPLTEKARMEMTSLYENGEHTLALLADLKLHLQAEHARLGQLRDGFLDQARSVSHLDLRA